MMQAVALFLLRPSLVEEGRERGDDDTDTHMRYVRSFKSLMKMMNGIKFNNYTISVFVPDNFL